MRSRCSRTSLSSCTPDSASGSSGPMASARRRSCAFSLGSIGPTPAVSAGARVSLLRQQPEFAPGRTLFDEARTALQELVAAHDDLVQTAEALATATDPAQKKSLAER